MNQGGILEIREGLDWILKLFLKTISNHNLRETSDKRARNTDQSLRLY